MPAALRSTAAVLAALAILALAACTTPPAREARTVYSDDGVSELTAPETWRTRPNLGRRATIRIGEDTSVTYLVVNSYRPQELEPMSFEEFAARVSAGLAKRSRGSKLSAPRRLSVNGRPAVEYEVLGGGGEVSLAYLSTVVDGEKARHHIVGWTLGERYRANRGALRAVAGSFRESAAPRAAKARTTLSFDWPEGLTSSAHVRSRSVKRGEVLEISMRAVSTVRPLGDDELLISARVTDRKFSPGTRDQGKAEYLERLVKEAMTDVPDYVVDREGEFVRTENLAPYLKRLEDALVNGLPDAPKEARAKAKDLVKKLVDERTLAASMQEEWNNIVGNWVDGSYVPGESYELETTYQAPALGERVFPMQVTQRLAAARERCHKGAAADSCVRLEQVSRVAGAEFTRATSAFVRKTLGSSEVAVEQAEVVKTVELVADPDTLLPYRSVVRETKRFTVSAKGAPPQASEEIRETVTTYTY